MTLNSGATSLFVASAFIWKLTLDSRGSNVRNEPTADQRAGARSLKSSNIGGTENPWKTVESAPAFLRFTGPSLGDAEKSSFPYFPLQQELRFPTSTRPLVPTLACVGEMSIDLDQRHRKGGVVFYRADREAGPAHAPARRVVGRVKST